MCIHLEVPLACGAEEEECVVLREEVVGGMVALSQQRLGSRWIESWKLWGWEMEPCG